MNIFSLLIVILWLAFIVYWFISGIQAKKNTHKNPGFRIVFIILFIIIFSIPAVRDFIERYNSVSSNPYIQAIGVILCAFGVAFAVWARVYLGKNWGMPMGIQENAELVTTGPYAYVRHPIYTGVIVAMLGSAFAVATWWFLFFILSSVYFIYSATQEEKLMLKQFPDQYPAYKKRTKMLIPYIF